MQKSICLILVLLALRGYSQRERIYVDIDKYTARPNDTLWIKAFVFKGMYPSRLSTNLYVRLYDEKACMLRQYIFPVMHGQSIGQLIIPDSIPTANYYLVAFTRQTLNFDSTNFFTLPVLVYNKDLPRSIHPKRQAPAPLSAAFGNIKGITWVTHFKAGELFSMLRLDSGYTPGKLRLIMPDMNDTTFSAEISLSVRDNSKYISFPADTSKDHARLLLYEDSTLLGSQFIPFRHEKSDVKLFTDTLDKTPYGYNSWRVVLPDSVDFFTSITVTDADRSSSSPISIFHLQDAYTDNLFSPVPPADTSYITYSGIASRQSGRVIRDALSRELTITGYRDSNFVFLQTVDVDAKGRFRIDSLLFFGNMDLQFQINKQNDRRNKDVGLELTRYIPSAHIDTSAFLTDWTDDTKHLPPNDTAFTSSEQQANELSRLKTLKPVVVRGWKNPRDGLDAKYTTGFFSEPAQYYYDLTKYTSDYNRDIYLFFNAQGSRIRYDILSDEFKDLLGHPLHFFVDEIERGPEFLRLLDFEKLAYIKVLESDFLSVGPPLTTKVQVGPLSYLDQKTAINVCIYSRKGTDFRTMRGGMNKLTIKGYDPILPFHPDRITLFCDRLKSGHQFHISFNNNDTARRFRLKLEGASYSGKIVHFETVIE